jgi:uncharacterized membrane protein
MSYSVTGWIHMAAAVCALLLGGVTLTRNKGTLVHRIIGRSYVASMLMLNVTALCLYDMTGYFGPFHACAIFSMTCIVIGVSAPIFRKGGWLKRHLMWMGWSYFGLLSAAFAETMVRVPAFAAHTATRGFEVAIGATVVFSFGGGLFMRWLRRSVDQKLSQTQHSSLPAAT